jgi:hypothetical protein
MFGIFHELGQNSRISEAKSKASDAKISSRRALQEINALNWKVEKLLMITEALWRTLKESQGLEDSFLENLVEEIDAEDGRLDGKVAKSPPLECPGCGRAMSATLKKCIYCGSTAKGAVFRR